MKNDSDKYLDPARNPFIKTEEVEGGDHYDPLEGKAPFGRFDLSSAEIAARLNMKYPGADTVDLPAGRRLLKMADGSWTLDAKPLSRLDAAELAELGKL